VFKYFTLAFQEENPRVIRIVITDDKNIPLASHGGNREELTVSIWSNCPGCSAITVLTREWMGCKDHLAMMTRSTNKVTLKLEQGQSSKKA
jgi:hypothetical protein